MTIDYSKDGLFFETNPFFELGTEVFIGIRVIALDRVSLPNNGHVSE